MGEAEWKCAKCGISLVVKKTSFTYMGRTFTHEVPRCEKCGAVFIPKELAIGRMKQVEQSLEDK